MNRSVRIYTDAEGRRQATLAASEKPEDELCDFCSLKSPPYKVYQCRDFAHPMNPDLWSRGEWNACALCAAFIDEEDYGLLLGRCIEIMQLRPDQVPPMAMLHQAFHYNRIRGVDNIEEHKIKAEDTPS